MRSAVSTHPCFETKFHAKTLKPLVEEHPLTGSIMSDTPASKFDTDATYTSSPRNLSHATASLASGSILNSQHSSTTTMQPSKGQACVRQTATLAHIADPSARATLPLKRVCGTVLVAGDVGDVGSPCPTVAPHGPTLLQRWRPGTTDGLTEYLWHIKVCCPRVWPISLWPIQLWLVYVWDVYSWPVYLWPV